MNSQTPLPDYGEGYRTVYEHRLEGAYERPLAEVLRYRLERLPRWLATKRLGPEARLLDVGCATGYLLELLHGLGYRHLEGIDASAEMLMRARARLPDEVVLHHGPAAAVLAGSADSSYDGIFLHHVIEHVPRAEIVPLLAELRRVLAPGGWLGLRTPNASCLLAGALVHGDITHVTPLSEWAILQALELAGFDPDSVEVLLHPPRLYWSWSAPVRAGARFLNRLRWHGGRLLDRSVCVLLDVRPRPRSGEPELEMIARR